MPHTLNERYRRLAPKTHEDRIFYAAALVAAMTVVLGIIIKLTEIRHISIGYVIPVLIAAIRWGVWEATVAAMLAIGAAAFFFYAPIYDFRVHDPLQIVDLILFLLVAVVTGHFATRLRIEAERANRRELEIGALYAFSRRLTAAKDASDIYDAIQQHLESLVGRGVMLFGQFSSESEAVERCDKAKVPQQVREAVLAALSKSTSAEEGILVDGGSAEEVWLVRAVSPQTPDFGVIAIDLGPRNPQQVDAMQAEIDAALVDAAATLHRLGLGRAITEAKTRTDTERLRDALLGSVSHELRTPLAAILGATTTLAGSPLVKSDARLSGLANIAREEAERLNHDIQNLLDATRISSDGIRPKFEWSEPADIVNAALDHRRTRLGGYQINVRLAPNLPLVYVDSVLIEQALGQVLDNAAKYSAPGTAIDIEGRCTDSDVIISVTDRGAGFSPAERSQAAQRFFRSERHAATVAGAGLGLWIAQAFIAANGGHLDIVSSGRDDGATVSILLPLPREPQDSPSAGTWNAVDA